MMNIPTSTDPSKTLRLPLLGHLPNALRNHCTAMLGEFTGTFMFLLLAFSSTQVANAAAAGADTGDASLAQVPNAAVLVYISLAFGFSLAVNAWVFFRISGGLFNPAVTLGMVLIGASTWVRGGLIVVAQLLGAMASSAVVYVLFPGPLSVSTTLSSGTSIARGLFIEMFLTAELVFTIFMLAAEKHKGTFLAPVGIGLALFVAELSGVYFTGGSLNPARSFGPCVVNQLFPTYHWIYWLGPAMGALLAVGFYRFVKVLEYETANPGQDFNEKEDAAFEFDEGTAATGADVVRPTGDELNQRSRSPDRSDESSQRSVRRTQNDQMQSSTSNERERRQDFDADRRDQDGYGVTAHHSWRKGDDYGAPSRDTSFRQAGRVESGDYGGKYRVSGL